METLTIPRALFKNTGMQMLGQAVSISVGFLTTAVLSRYLGVDAFGQFNYVFALYLFFLPSMT